MGDLFLPRMGLSLQMKWDGELVLMEVYRIPFGINHLEMHRLVASSAALSNHPPLTTTSLNPRLNCFPTPLPVLPVLLREQKFVVVRANGNLRNMYFSFKNGIIVSNEMGRRACPRGRVGDLIGEICLP
ncbi:hypothetical protein CEXT_712991 [Caerostris extrusa]|uniref:Uncharacterized protein n=1 Tax=Caerostris extrusa TaxID=172846 RepID=A0AAV4T830_CAEEX|nr:hypothetical protein CEXT_712991 [Caerostris extrusa]